MIKDRFQTIVSIVEQSTGNGDCHKVYNLEIMQWPKWDSRTVVFGLRVVRDRLKNPRLFVLFGRDEKDKREVKNTKEDHGVINKIYNHLQQLQNVA